MASPGTTSANLESFHAHLRSSRRILALLGAGLSASSGIATFRDARGIWRTHGAAELATLKAFLANPGLVWQFYSWRRHMALKAMPNRAHKALAELAKRRPDFHALSQNSDGLSERAGHPHDQLHLIHGTLFDVKCNSVYCDYVEHGVHTDPIVPALAIPTAPDTDEELDISDPAIALPELCLDDLPRCPACRQSFLRPGVVWWGEQLSRDTLRFVDDFLADPAVVDLMLVIGTSSSVDPAASFVDRARARGARVAVVNLEPTSALRDGDWFFQGDATTLVPQLLRPVVGDVL